MPGVYLHIPFCRQACIYCDFHFSTGLSSKKELVSRIAAEIGLRKDYLGTRHLQSIYFGGGTPSLLSGAELAEIFAALSAYFSWDQGAEITLEANPDDIDAATLKAWKNAGINRLSIGLQSFNDEELRWMNRAHTAAQSLASVKMAQDAGFGNITIDLIYGSKFQTPATWERTLQQAIGLDTQHISAYNLTIEKQTVLGLKHLRGKEPAVSDELSSRQFLAMSQALEEAGFVHYEISNFGKEGYFASHNSNYWLQHHYLGLGPSAHSFNGVSRQWNISNNAVYSRAIASGETFYEKEELSVNDRYNEYVLTRLRTIWGCDVKEIESLFGKDLALHFRNSIALKKDLIEEKDGAFTLRKEARLLADGIAADLFI